MAVDPTCITDDKKILKREYMKNYMRQYRLKKKTTKPIEENVWANEQDVSHLPSRTQVA